MSRAERRAVLAGLLAGLGGVTLGCIGVSQSLSHSSGPIGEPRSCPALTMPAPDGLIDDFEDGNTQLAPQDGRDGYWWTGTDEKGSAFLNADLGPVEGGGSGSSKAIHVYGKTSDAPEAWGINFGANFSSAGLYDAKRYVGIEFRAKVGTADASRRVRLKIGDVNTHPDFGVCKDCWNHFGKDISLSTEWKEYTVLFSGVRQAEGWGDPRPSHITVNQLFSLDFSVGPGQAFDIWIDDVRFLTCK